MSLDNFFDRVDVLFKPVTLQRDPHKGKTIQLKKIALPIVCVKALNHYYGETVNIRKINNEAIEVTRSNKC